MVGRPKAFSEDQRVRDLRKKVAKVKIYVMFEVFALAFAFAVGGPKLISRTGLAMYICRALHTHAENIM